MKFNLQNVGAVLVLVGLAYVVGKKKAATVGGSTAAGSPAEPITGPAQWWSFAGSWQ